ncbi:MAG: hypothetical protein ACTSUN_10795 [Promethearchaeota archaeon]
MNIFRLLKWIVRGFVGVIIISLVLFMILNVYSVYLIVSNPEVNLKVPDGEVTYDFNILEWDEMHFTVPFSITNAGYYDIQDIFIYINLTAIYGVQNHTKLIFSKLKSFGIISAGETLKDEYKVGPNDFFQSNIIAIIHETFRNPGPIQYQMDIIMGGRFSLNLMSTQIQTRLIF